MQTPRTVPSNIREAIQIIVQALRRKRDSALDNPTESRLVNAVPTTTETRG